jgi:hypothetical protein
MSKSAEELEEMFDTVLANIDGPSVGFIESLYEQWEEKKWLSEKQIASLEKFYDNIDEGKK